MRISGRTCAAGLFGAALALSPKTALGQTGPQAPLTLASALEIAIANSPVLAAAAARVEEAAGDLTQAAVWVVDNPALTASRARRSALSGVGSFEPEFEIGLEQRIEIAGQRGKRIGAARAGVEATRDEADDARRIIELAVATAFYEGVAAAERVELAQQNEEVASRLLDLAQRRLAAGIGTPLEVNAATVRLAEARRLRLTAVAGERVAFLRLVSHLGVELPDTTALDGDLPSVGPRAVEETVIARALARRPDLAAEARRLEAAESSARLAGAESWPDVSIMASLGQEEGTELFSAGFRIPLALFNRNQGGRQAAAALRERAKAQGTAIRLEVIADARVAVTLYEQSRAGVQLYDTDVLGALEESSALMQLAVESGELGVADVLVVQAELLSGQMGHLAARLALATAGARLRAAIGAAQSAPLQEVVR